MPNDIGDVRARMTLDTSAFDSKLKQATASVEPSARAIEKAAKAAAQAQATASKYAGDTVSEQTRRIVAARAQEVQASRDLTEFQKAVRNGYMDEATASTGSLAAVQKQIAARRTLAELMKSESAGHGFTDRMAASAVVRGLEGNAGIRSVESVLTMVPGFNAAAQTLAKVMGTAGLIGIAVELGEKLYTAFDIGGVRARQTAEEVSRISLEVAHSNTSLDVQIDKLQQEQAKLEKKPFNGIKLVLDEASEAAQKLQERLEGVLQKELKGISDMSASLPQRILAGGSQTKYEQTMLQEHDKWLGTATNTQQQYNESVSYGNSLQVRLNDLLGKQKLADDAAAEASKRGVVGTGSTRYTEEIRAIQALMGWQKGEQETIQKTMDLSKQARSTQGARDTAEAARIAAEAGRKATEAKHKVSETLYRGYEEDLAQMKLASDVSAKAEYDFWDARRQAFERGSQQYLAIIDKQAALAVEGRRKAHELIKEFEASQRRQSEWNVTAQPEADRGIAENAKRIVDKQIEDSKVSRLQADAVDSLAVANARAAASLAEVAVSTAAGRTITQYDAAVRLATLHTAAYGVELDALNAKAARVASARDLTDAQKQQELGKIAVDAKNLQTSQASVMLRDQAAMGKNDTSATVGAKDALNELAAAARDSAKDMRDMISTSLRSLNEAILDPKRGGFKEAGANILRTGASTLLNKAEGSLLQGLGFGGKPDGSASNPLHVVMAGLPGFQMPTTLTNSLTKLPDMGGQSLASLGASMMGLLPGFAEGGDVMAGTMNIIGEKGPELFMPRTSGTVMSNTKAQAMFGGGGGNQPITIHQDMRGAFGGDRAIMASLTRQASQQAYSAARSDAARDQVDKVRRQFGGVRR